ncbi:tocopherol cyclase family protein [Clostridium sp. DL1XJH146]
MNKHYNKTIFQGRRKDINNRYFEGWYLKQVSKDGTCTISFIPGISYSNSDSHSFIQVIIRNELEELSSYYFSYDLKDAIFKDSPFEITIGECTFSKSGLTVVLKNNEISIKGNLTFNQLSPLPTTFLNPNIMGFFSYIPNMECNHHVISMEHGLVGELIINGEIVKFEGGKGYMEKDWGRSFPREYMWIQCNHFNIEGLRLVLSVAEIPFMWSNFQGFFCSLLYNDKEYRFATYNGSKIKINQAGNGMFDVIISNRKATLKVKGKVDTLASLTSPKDGTMNDTIKEGLAGTVELVLTDNVTNNVLTSTGSNAGIEVMMNI